MICIHKFKTEFVILNETQLKKSIVYNARLKEYKAEKRMLLRERYLNQ